MRAKIKSTFKNLIPFSWHFYLEQKERANADAKAQQNRHDVVNFELSSAAYFQVYWKIYGMGRGPALALYIDHEEVLKFDFYGAGKGHYHSQAIQPSPCKHNVLYLPESTTEAQIERAIFELEHNLYWYLERHPLKTVRTFSIKKKKLQETLSQIRPILIRYAAIVPVEATNQPSELPEDTYVSQYY
jgi:hypothetical protein